MLIKFTASDNSIAAKINQDRAMMSKIGQIVVKVHRSGESTDTPNEYFSSSGLGHDFVGTVHEKVNSLDSLILNWQHIPF